MPAHARRRVNRVYFVLGTYVIRTYRPIHVEVWFVVPTMGEWGGLKMRAEGKNLSFFRYFYAERCVSAK